MRNKLLEYLSKILQNQEKYSYREIICYDSLLLSVCNNCSFVVSNCNYCKK